MLPEEIQTDRLALRPFSLTDAAAVFDYSSDPAWGLYQSLPSPYTRPDADRFVAKLILRDREESPTWAMTLEGRVIGIVSVSFLSEHRIAVLGYGVHTLLWGKGFCVEATRAVLNASFRSYEQLKRLRAHIDARNLASIRVLEKLGFSHEGTLRSNQYERGTFVDEGIFGLLREDWAVRK